MPVTELVYENLEKNHITKEMWHIYLLSLYNASYTSNLLTVDCGHHNTIPHICFYFYTMARDISSGAL